MHDLVDSRTSSFSLKRAHDGASRPVEDGNPSLPTPRKRARRLRNSVRDNIQDFVPTGATFSRSVIPSDPDGPVGLEQEPHEDSGSAPSINWNTGSKAKIRTSFRDRSSGLQVGGVSKPDPSSSRVNDAIVHEVPAVAPSSARTTSVDPGNSVPESGTGQGKMIDELSSNEEVAATVDTSHTGDPPTQLQVVKDGLSNPSLEEEPENLASEEAVSVNDEGEEGSSDEIESGQITDDDSYPITSQPSGDSVDNNSENQDALMDYSQSNGMARDTIHQPQTSSKPLTLAELSPKDLELQFRYFFTTKARNEVDMSTTVRCLTCNQEGHLAAACDEPNCTTCGKVDDHCTKTCPLKIRCEKCKVHGHHKSACTSKLTQPSSAVTCELCQRKGHVSENCELIWRTSGRPWESDLSSRAIRLECYECGTQGHLGNDCRSRRPGKQLGTSSWTYPGGSHMTNLPKDEITIKGRAKQQQVIIIDDSDDEQANFLRPKAQPRERPAPMKIATHGGKWFGNHQTDFGAHPSGQKSGYRQNDLYTGTAYGAARDRGQYSQRPADRRSLSPRTAGHNIHGSYRSRGNEPNHAWNDGGYRGNSRPFQDQPPLPQGPPPGAQSLSLQKRSQERRGEGSYMPMPSAAQKAWKQHRI